MGKKRMPLLDDLTEKSIRESQAWYNAADQLMTEAAFSRLCELAILGLRAKDPGSAGPHLSDIEHPLQHAQPDSPALDPGGNPGGDLILSPVQRLRNAERAAFDLGWSACREAAANEVRCMMVSVPYFYSARQKLVDAIRAIQPPKE